jgi:hypothetical protein
MPTEIVQGEEVDTETGEVLEGDEMPNGRAVAVQKREQVAGLIRPVAPPSEVLAAQEETRALIEEALTKGRDYDVIPGTNKPSLLKPGGERITAAMGCFPRYRIAEREVDHDREFEWTKRKKRFEQGRFVGWEEESGVSHGLYRYVIECDIVHRGSGVVIGHGIGACSTMESRYIDRPRDSENTVLKMAEKRAFVGAVLNAFGLSDQFTQDVEDNPDLVPGRDGSTTAPPSGEPEARCPKCQGPMWDNRASKTNPKAPDYKCRDKSCDGLYWPGQWPPKGQARLTELVKQLDDVALQGKDAEALVAAKALAKDGGPDAHIARAIGWAERLLVDLEGEDSGPDKGPVEAMAEAAAAAAEEPPTDLWGDG